MKTNNRFLLAAILAVAMALTFSCSDKNGDGGDGGNDHPRYGWYGDGSATNYTISTAEQLKGLSSIVRGGTREEIGDKNVPSMDDFSGKTITLTADIDLSGESDEWRSIGYSNAPEHPFNGVFDGGNKTISGLHVGEQGFFGKIGKDGTVKNIVFADFSLTNGGGILAKVNEGTIQNVGINGNATGNTVGGVVSTNRGIIENSYFSGSITTTDGAGGIAAYNEGTIRNCYSAGNISAAENASGVTKVGGIVLNNSTAANKVGTVQNCYSTSDVTADYAGGIVYDNSEGGSTVQNCYATGSVTANSSTSYISATGIATKNSASSTRNGTIQNCVAINQSIKKENNRVARISGDGSFINNYGLEEMAMPDGYTIVSDAAGKDGENITAAELNDASWWQNTVEFPSDVWEFGTGLPILKNMPAGTQNPEVQQ